MLLNFTSKGPYEVGTNTIKHKDKEIETVLNSKEYLAFINDLNERDFRLVKVGRGEEHRPDLLANRYYNSPMYYWVIMETNDITDPYESLNSGDIIKIINFIPYL
tara:strand:- start:289 stop:603 length:315 start_codon:yes stop_codon:yes gene_type:complete